MKKQIFFILVFSLIVLISLSGCIQREESLVWESLNGPPGGKIYELIQNSYKHNELYTLTDRGLYKSEDKGESWRLMKGPENFRVNFIAVYEDRLFVCSNGVYYYDSNEKLVRVYDGWCEKIAISGDKLFVTNAGREIEHLRIVYSDLKSEKFDWHDITPSASELNDIILPSTDIGFDCIIRVPHIVTVGTRILANIMVEMGGGSGECSNGHLYKSEDLGKTWSKIELNKPDELVISNIIQEPNDEEHIIVVFQHRLHDSFLPLHTFLRESYDGGLTWSSVTNIDFEVNFVGDVDVTESSYYITVPKDDRLLKLNKLNRDDYEVISMPRAEGYDKNIIFYLEEILFDLDDPTTVYGRTTDLWAFGLVKSEDGMQTWRKMDSDIVASSPSIVVVHPTNPNVIFTTGNTAHEAYLTRDGGITWKPFSRTTFGDELKIDPHNHNHLILIDENTALFESYDLGRTWTGINTGFGGGGNSSFSSAKIFDFEIVKDGSNKIYVSNLGLGISEYNPLDGQWNYLLNSSDYTYDLEIDPEDSNIVYASYSPKIFENYASVWKYSKYQKENSGWSEILRVENSTGITSLRFDSSDPNKIYAGVTGKEGAIYVSDDKGRTWHNLNEDLTFTTIHAMEVDPNDEEEVYAAPWGGGLFKTSDGGLSWSKISGNKKEEPFSVAAIKVNPVNSNQLYAEDRSEATLWASDDKGNTWFVKWRPGEEYFRLNTFTFDPSNPNIYYVSAWKHGRGQPIGELFRHNEDESWDDITNELPRAVLDIEVDPTNSDTLYAALHVHGMYKSTNGGQSWQEITSFPRVGAFDLAFNNGAIYAATNCGDMPEALLEGLLQVEGDCGVYKSTNNGETWINIAPKSLKTTAIKQIAFSKENIYIATNNDAYVSSDESNWQSLNVPFKETASIAVTENKVYVGTHGAGVYQSNVNSINWNTKGPFAEIYNIQIITDPSNSDTLYASSYPGGVFKSTDQGITWNEKNFALPSFRVEDPKVQGYYSLEIDPNNSNTLYLGMFGKGIFKSFDGAATWTAMYGNQGQNSEIMRKGITKIKVDPSNSNNVYLATNDGVYFSEDEAENWKAMNDGLKTLDIRSLKITKIEYPPFKDDFEDGNADGWELPPAPNLTGTWSVINDNGNYVFQGVGHIFANAGSESWTDYILESRVKLIEDGVHVNYRLKEGERYFISMSEGGLHLVRMLTENNAPVHTELARDESPLEKNTWIPIKIIGKGNNIKVYVNNVLKINYTDDTPVLNGKIAFESLDDSKVYVDDIHVTLDKKADTVIYAGTAGYGVYKFDPSSEKWENLGRTLGSGWWSPWDRRMYQFSSLLFDPDVPGKIYYGHFPGGFYISEDNGYGWRDSSIGLGNDGMFSLYMHPHNHSILFGGTYNGIAKSEDGGKTWELKGKKGIEDLKGEEAWRAWEEYTKGIMPPEQWPYTVAIDSNNPDIIYMTTKNGRNKGYCHRNMNILGEYDRSNFCGIVMKSTDGGETWFEIMKGIDWGSEFYTLIIYPENHNILFLSSNKGVYLSRDAGNSWKPINKGLPTRENQVRDNVADNLALTNNNYLILGLTNHGVWKADLSKLG